MNAQRIDLHPAGPLPYALSEADLRASLKPFEVPGAAAAVVVCPGGAYLGKADHEGDPVARRLNEGGIAAYVLDYRVKPCHPLAPLSDAQRAIQAVRAMGYRHVGILGFSAGAHLACSAAVHYVPESPQNSDPISALSSRPDFFVPCYPVVSFTSYPHIGSCLALLGEQPDHRLERYFSAELNVTPDTPPAFIWHTANDASVPVENSLMLAAALSRAGVDYEMHIYPDGPHGLGLAEDREDVSQWSRQCIDFINRHFH